MIKQWARYCGGPPMFRHGTAYAKMARQGAAFRSRAPNDLNDATGFMQAITDVSVESTKAAVPAALAVDAKGVSLTFETSDGQVEALSKVDLQINAGDFVSFIGPSGCGKTTLLR